MPSYFPQEYTPELTEEFYRSLARPIEEQTARNVGLARSEALSRGLEGDPFEAIGVSAARRAGTESLADLYANLGWQGAGWAREERLGETERDWRAEEAAKSREWQSAEAAKSRASQEKLMELQYKLAKKNRPGFWDYLGYSAGQALPFLAFKKWG